MPNSFYNHSTYPPPNAPGSSAALRNELDLITAGFNLLPTLSGNGYKVAMVNAAGTALVASNALQDLSINNSPIGATTPSTGAFTTLSATAGTLVGLAINNSTIGATTPSTGSFTTLSATGGTLSNVTLSAPTINNAAINAATTAITQTLGTSNNTIATTAFVTNTSFATALPGQTGNAGKLLTTDGTNASWICEPGAVGNVLTSDGTTWISAMPPASILTQSQGYFFASFN